MFPEVRLRVLSHGSGGTSSIEYSITVVLLVDFQIINLSPLLQTETKYLLLLQTTNYKHIGLEKKNVIVKQLCFY